MSEVADLFKHINHSQYPLLLVLVKDRGQVNLSAMARGHDAIDSVMEKLMSGLDRCMSIKNKDAAEEQSRLERQAFRDQQVEEYEQSLAIDRARQEELQKQRQLEM
jgi:hypothetical protein